MSIRTLIATLAGGALGVALLAGAPAAADTLPEAGDECKRYEVGDTVELEDGTVLECQTDEDNVRVHSWVVTVEPSEEPSEDPSEKPSEDPSEEPSKEPEPTEKPGDDPARDTVVALINDCDGVAGALEFGDHDGKYRYSVWHDDVQVTDKVKAKADSTETWQPVEASEVRVTVDHKLPGGSYVNVKDVTHTYEAPKKCDEDDNGKPDDGDKGDDKPAPTEEPTEGDDAKPVESGASESLPVTGGALAGLVAAGLAALSAGGGAVYLARKRKLTADA